MKTEIEQEIEAFNEMHRVEGTNITASYEAVGVFFEVDRKGAGYLSIRIHDEQRHGGWSHRFTYFVSTSTRAETRDALRRLMRLKPFFTPSHSLETLERPTSKGLT